MTPRQKIQSENHPSAGSIITSKPITDKAKIERIKANLADHPRNLALFVVGINSAFRAGDLLSLTVGDVKGDVIRRREKKTGKVREFYLNRAIKMVVATLVKGRKNDDWLFPSELTGEPLNVSVFSGMVKSWCFKVGLRKGYSSHTLRKTWARAQADAGEPIYKISDALGHSSEKVTRIYIGLQLEDMKSMFMREV